MSFAPLAPWPPVTLLLAAALATMLAALGTGRLGGRGRGAIVALHAGAGLLLWLAAMNPVRQRGEREGSHLAVVLDVSESVQRAGRDWTDVRAKIGEALGETLSSFPPRIRRSSTASLVTCARGVHTVARDVLLGDLRRVVSRLTEDELPPPGASDLEAGLAAAGEALEEAGRGAAVIVTDGHETRGDARAAARRLGRRGFPVHVIALGGRSPEVGLYAADLPPQAEAETPTAARLLLANGAAGPLDLELVFRRGDGEPASRRATLAGAGWFHLRQPLVFDQPGLRFLDLELRAGGGQRQERRFFTYVSAPPRILVVGDDHRWTQALPAAGFRVETSSPEALDDGFDPALYDAVVLHETWSDRLGADRLARLAAAARTSGTGLLLVNGPQRGDAEAQTMLMSYDGTPLEELLPVVNEPRPVLEAPPPRRIVLLIDTSGSMQGWPLAKAKEIAAAVIDRLRAIDRLHLIAFTGGAHPLLSDLAMTGQGKEEALGVVGSLRAGGGTDPTQALALIEERRLDNCGLFMISDGEFAAVTSRPDCEATVFAIGKRAGGVPAALAQIAEPFPVPDDSFSPAGIRIGFFDPEPRHNRFEPGPYTPLPGIDAFAGGWSLLPEPALPLAGNAVTHARDDAELAAVRPRPRDPVLAFRDVTREGDTGVTEEGGTVGAFTTALPSGYYGSLAGARAVRAWIERLLAHSERDRYAFRLEDRGAAIDLRLTLLAKGGVAPRVSRLSASLETAGSATVPVALRPDAELAGVFSGTLRLPRRPAAATRGRLVVAEGGPDALRRPQRIPIVIPPAGDVGRIVGDEAWSFGLAADLLRDVAALSGGRVLEPGEDAVVLHGAGVPPASRSLWPWLVAAAIVLVLAQVAVRRALA